MNLTSTVLSANPNFSKAPAKRVQHFIKHYTTFLAHCCMLSSKTKSTKECGGKITSAAHARVQKSTTKLHGVAKRVQPSHNIAEDKRNVVSYNICLVKSLIAIKLHTTRYNTIQHDTTRYNKVAKRVQRFIKHQSCMMLYEMLYSFGRGLS